MDGSDVFFACYSNPYNETQHKDGIIRGMNFLLNNTNTRKRGHFFLFTGALAILFCIALGFTKNACAVTSATTTPQNSSAQSLTLLGTRFDLSTSTPTIAQTGELDWKVAVRPSPKAQSAQIRFEVRRQSGALIYRRTHYLNNLDKKTKGKKTVLYTESFQRDLTGLSMGEGTYTIAVEATISNGPDRETASLYSCQYIYDNERSPQQWACALHFSSMPLRDADGVFVVDPSTGTPEAQREALTKIASLATARKNSRITLYISPLLLEDFEAASKGYTLKLPSAAKAQKVDATSVVAQRYTNTLTALSDALSSGALSLGTVGFSDPNLTALSQANMTDDIELQYSRALSTLTPLIQKSAQSLDASHTAPLGTRLSDEAVSALTDAKITGVVLSDKAVSTSKHPVGMLNSSIVGYVSDSTLSDIIASKESTAVTDAFFDSYQAASQDDEPLIVTHTLISNEDQARKAVANIDLLYSQPWLKPVTFGEITPKKINNAPRLALKKVAKSKQTDFEKKVYKARRASEGLVFALDENVKSISAREDSLIAENGTPTTTALTPLAKATRLAYAEKANKLASSVFKKVTVKVASVTLSGHKGKVPITIKNNNKEEVRIVLRFNTSSGLSFDAKPKALIGLPPQETFLEPNVEMQNASRGKLNMTLTAGKYVVCEKTVDISASYIDTIVIVVIVVVIGVVLILFIYQRVKAADVEVNLFTGEEDEETEEDTESTDI